MRNTGAGSRAVGVDRPTSAVQVRWVQTERVLGPAAVLEWAFHSVLKSLVLAVPLHPVLAQP